MAGKKDRIERINSQAVPLPEAFIDWMDRRMPRYIIYEPVHFPSVFPGS